MPETSFFQAVHPRNSMRACRPSVCSGSEGGHGGEFYGDPSTLHSLAFSAGDENGKTTVAGDYRETVR